MEHTRLAEAEYRFACIVWEHEPLPSGKLVELCAAQLGWKKSTTYTVLKKLCEKGLFENDGGTVIVRMDRQQYLSAQSRQFVDDSFSGSLPAFLAAFAQGGQLSEQDISEMRRLIEDYGKEG